MFDGNFRSQIEAGLRPVGNGIRKAGITADMITTAGVVMAVGAAVAIGAGALSLGLLLMILTGVPDLIDGAVAKAWGQTSKRGAFFDSVSDRLTDGLLFGGVAFYLTSTDGRPWIVMLPVAAYVSASLVSYIRAKADALGFDARGGLVERAERFILLGLGLLFGPPVLLWILGVIVALNLVTAGQRFVKVWRQATDQTPALSDRRRRRPRSARATGSLRSADRSGRRQRSGAGRPRA